MTVLVCPFGEEKCWFLHKKEEENLTSRVTSGFNCNFCDKIFVNQSEFLAHRKRYHSNFVPLCRKFTSGTCRYTNAKCWFDHNEIENLHENEKLKENEKLNENKPNEKNVEENNEVIQKILKMMESFTEQIIQMKEINNLK